MNKYFQGFPRIIIIVLFIVGLSIGCEKKDENNNQPPYCEIQTPIANQEFIKGENVIIQVDANDNDGEIKDVGLFLDGYRLNYSNYPESYQMSTLNTSIGEHVIRAICIDNENKSGFDEITIRIYEDEVKDLALTTTRITGITHQSAYSGGIITVPGHTPIVARGICWSTSPFPSLDDFYTLDGEGEGQFISKLTNLSEGTTYYIKAYAINASDTAYGDRRHFTTDSPATVITYPVSPVYFTNAISGGDIPDDGGALVTQKGVCWSTTNPPDIGDDHTSEGITSTEFSSSISGLVSNTTYYLRAYVITAVGTSYGEIVEFKTLLGGNPCPGTPSVTDYNGNTYGTVQINSQCWMRENLQSTHYSDGTPMVDGTTLSIDIGDTNKYFFNYPNNPTISAEYGKLYAWAAVMNGAEGSNSNPSGVQGVCPTGWHVPSTEEWLELLNYMGGTNLITGGMIKETGTLHWESTNLQANNDCGFTALPAGRRDAYVTTWNDMYKGAYFRSSTYDYLHPSFVRIYLNNSLLISDQKSPRTGMSVRCVKN